MSDRLSLCMIVRDEEEYLPRCLESVQGLVDEVIIVDTGSCDATVAIARRYGAVIKEIAWPNDFAAARNEALSLATGDWVLSLDADEALAADSGTVLAALVKDGRYEGYYVTIQNLQGRTLDDDAHVEVASAFRLWRNRSLYRFVGSIHEQILPVIMAANPQAVVVPSPLTVVHYGYLTETVRAKSKENRNIDMLEAELARHPENQFLQFCLGGEYYLRGRYRQARSVFAAAVTKTPADASWRPPLVKFYTAALAELGMRRETLALLQEETVRYPDFTDLTYLMGSVQSHVGQHDQAIAAFRRCLELGPAPCPPYWPIDPELGACKAYAALGTACEVAGRYAEAMDGYAKAAMAKRGWLEPVKRLTKLMAQRVDDTKMVRVLEAFYPGDTPQAAATIASLLAHSGRYDLAIQRLEPLARAGELERGGRFAYAFCLAKVGRYDDALSLCHDGWSGTAFEPQVQALTLYCRLLAPEGGALGLPLDDARLKPLYADLAAIVAEDPPGVVAKIRRSLPKSKLLMKALTRKQ